MSRPCAGLVTGKPFLQALPKLFRGYERVGMPDARCQEFDIKVRQKFTVSDLLVPIRSDESARSVFSQVIESKTLLIPEPHLWHLQPIVDLKPTDTTTGNHHLNHQVWQYFVGANAV